ncbi:MAG: multidrug efflux SMR transporter [Leptolyngbya sp. Prado105]|jgi:small multidrug resistance pump|nr:multidrug efflux SMR transporter [Leptolyngbya sp. Prado105]
MSYIYLILAIAFEVLGTFFIKRSDGFTKLLPSIILFVYYGLSSSALTLAAKKIDISIAYSVWTGSSIALVAVMGMFWLKEPISELKILSVSYILVGVFGLLLTQKS